MEEVSFVLAFELMLQVFTIGTARYVVYTGINSSTSVIIIVRSRFVDM